MAEPTRRDFLHAAAATAALGAVGTLAAPTRAATPRPTATCCIHVHMVGGPSQLDTFDPKPDAPSDVRGPFGTIPTRTPGVRFSELFPKLAAMSDKFALVRSMTSTAAPVHELGLQLANTGHAFGRGTPKPNLGALYATQHGDREWPNWHLLSPGEIDLGFGFDIGQDDAPLAVNGMDPVRCLASVFDGGWFRSTLDPAVGSLRYWQRKTGRHFVTVNQFSTVFGRPTWDCHAAGGSLNSTLGDYRDTVAPSFDTAFADLLDTLDRDGLLSTTLVVATGEFGRTPRLNGHGGRDHWAGCWTALVAGGGVRGGAVVGASDAHAAEPKDRPVAPQDLFATMAHALSVTHDVPGQVVRELF